MSKDESLQRVSSLSVAGPAIGLCAWQIRLCYPYLCPIFDGACRLGIFGGEGCHGHVTEPIMKSLSKLYEVQLRPDAIRHNVEALAI